MITYTTLENVSFETPYKHFISLGYFCSVALELERFGLRSTSSPFDWCISNFEGVINAIENHFDSFLAYEYLLQSDTTRNYYFNEKYKIWFFHDFDKYNSLKKQLPDVRDKYLRRIERFYVNIKQPTLFIRYISDEELNDCGKSTELEYIERHHNYILSLLKSFNEENDIIYIANDGVNSNILQIYNVSKDENSAVARRPFDKNITLNNYFMQCDYEEKCNNMNRFNQKQKRKNNIFIKIYNKLKSVLKQVILNEYVHDKIISRN